MKINNFYKGILFTSLAAIIWGIATPFVKVGLNSIPPFSFLFLRCLITSIILFTVFETRIAKAPKVISYEDKKTITLAGLTGVFLNIAFYFVGQDLTSVSDAGVIMSLGSIAVVAYAYFFRHERLSKLVYLGVILAFIGSLFIIGSPILSIGSGSIIGNIMLMGAVLSGATAFFLIKDLSAKFSPLYLTYCFFIVSLPFAAPGFVLEFVQNPYWLSNISLSGYLALVYTVLGSSIIAYFFHSYGLKFLSASHASVLGYLSGIIAVLASFVVLKEQLTIPFAIGTIIIIIGLFLAETRHRHTK